MGDAAWELAAAPDEYLVSRWADSTEGTRRGHWELPDGRQQRFLQPAERENESEIPCTTSNCELVRRGCLRKSI